MTPPEGTPAPRLAQHAAGLTLIELLVAAALMLIVMAAVFNVNLTSTRATTLLPLSLSQSTAGLSKNFLANTSITA